MRGPPAADPPSPALRRSYLEPVGGAPPPSTSTLTLLSWNVLADGLAQSGRWAHCPPHLVEWDARGPGLLAEIDAAAPDVLCLQEANHWAGWWAPQLAARGYVGAFWAKPGSPAARCGGPPDGCAVAWKGARFSLVGCPEGRPFDARCLAGGGGPAPPPSSNLLDSAATDEEGSSGGAPCPPGAVVVTESGGTLPAPTPPRGVQGSLVVTLADALSGRSIVVGCTHLKAKAGAEEEVVRGRQAAEAAARVVRAGEKAAGQPVLILAGDFNAGPGTAAVRAPASVGLSSVWEAEPWPWSTFKFRTAGVGREAAAAGPQASRGLVDHVFFSGAALDARWPAIPDEAVPEGLPCAGYPSDHVAVVGRWRV